MRNKSATYTANKGIEIISGPNPSLSGLETSISSIGGSNEPLENIIIVKPISSTTGRKARLNTMENNERLENIIIVKPISSTTGRKARLNTVAYNETLGNIIIVKPISSTTGRKTRLNAVENTVPLGNIIIIKGIGNTTGRMARLTTGGSNETLEKIKKINTTGTTAHSFNMKHARAKYTANMGTGLISVANPNRNGSGTIVSIITGASNGTLVKSISIKATGNTTRGMIRLYCYLNASYIMLLKEIEIPAVTQSAIDHSFSTTVNLNFKLGSGYIIKASTENAENFIVKAEGLDWAY